MFLPWFRHNRLCESPSDSALGIAMLASRATAVLWDQPPIAAAAVRSAAESGYAMLAPLPLGALIGPVATAEAALARLDERLVGSPVGSGCQARAHFADACAALGLAGQLVHGEDLVLLDAEMLNYAATPELVRASHILNDRRRIAAGAPGAALAPEGLDALRGRAPAAHCGGGEPAEGGGADAAFDAFGAI